MSFELRTNAFRYLLYYKPFGTTKYVEGFVTEYPFDYKEIPKHGPKKLFIFDFENNFLKSDLMIGDTFWKYFIRSLKITEKYLMKTIYNNTRNLKK
jgi:hypothetical protein